MACALALVTLFCFPRLAVAAEGSPAYTALSIVNAATQTSRALAPNTIATIYGKNLAFSTRAVGNADLKGSILPTSLDGVAVLVGGFTAPLFYVSPTQINFLIPYELVAGIVPIAVTRQSLAGPVIKVQLNATSPGLFLWNGNYAIASHLTGKLIAADAPAKPGEIIILYAAGLGRASPDTTSGKVVASAAKIAALAQLQVTIGETLVPAADILYAGLAPGFAGLYQINLRMPAKLGTDPEIRLSVNGESSLPGVRLAVQGAGLAVD